MNKYRDEYNSMLYESVVGASNTHKELYLTVTTNKADINEARSFFARIGYEISGRLSALSSQCEDMKLKERLKIFHDFYRAGDEEFFLFDFNDSIKKGHSFKDNIAPTSLEFKKDHFIMGDRYGRILFLMNYANYLKDTFLTALSDLNADMMLSMDIIPVPSDEAFREIENKLLGIETNITQWQRRQNSKNNFSAIIPYDMELQRKEARELLDDITARDQRLMFGLLTIVYQSGSKEKLDSDTQSLISMAQQHLCEIAPLTFQQADGLSTALPYGVRKIDALRTLTTESAAAFMPFKAQNITHKQGIFFGTNAINKSPLLIDRREMLNGNMFILGVSGAGKSFIAKQQIVNLILATDADVLIIDPEAEFSALTRALGGSVVKISSTSDIHINPFDINKEYNDGANPITLKSELMLSITEQSLGHVSAQQKSIIDRCTEMVLSPYVRGGCVGSPPTMKDFYEALIKQPEKEAKELALGMELFIVGSLNTFAHQTNVDLNNRFISFDILELGQLQNIGSLIILDSIFNRITKNRAEGRQTYVFIDEIYLMFMHQFSGEFLYKLWKRIRKYNGFINGITQNVLDLLQSHTARTMLSNTELIVMLNQSATDRIELAELLNISDTQLSYVTDAKFMKSKIQVAQILISIIYFSR